jgi:hypothetical protein
MLSQLIAKANIIQIKLIFSNFSDNRMHHNFLPFIYQQKNNSNANNITVYDISKDKFSEQLSILPDKENMNFLYNDKHGFNGYIFCQTSDIE